MTQKHELIQQVADEKELVGINRFANAIRLQLMMLGKFDRSFILFPN